MDNLYEYGRYAVQLIDDCIEDGYEVAGYAVVNKHTDVREYTTTVLFNAMKWCRICESNVSAIEKLADGEDDAELQWGTGAVEARPH